VITLDRVRRALSAYGPPAPPERLANAQLAAVALIFVPAADGLEALLIRRAVRAGDPWSGQVALPGGRHAPVDVDLEATAIRETYEELAVDLARAERMGVLNDIRPRTNRLPPVLVRPFIFALPNRPSLNPSAEVQSAFWTPLARFLAPGTRRDVRLAVPGGERTFPAFVLDQDIIWGMTERILSTFLASIDHQNP
jgi:8-oxo-dGTP pyrophosphatase MutT (NUDIX family)